MFRSRPFVATALGLVLLAVAQPVGCAAAGANTASGRSAPEGAAGRSAAEAVAALAGRYRITNADGDRACPLVLTTTPATGGGGRYGVELDQPACTQAILFTADIFGWRPGAGNSILLETRQGRLIAEFTEGVAGTWEALRENDGVYFLVNPALAEPSRVPEPAELAGPWSLGRADGGPACRVELKPEPDSAGRLPAVAEPACAPLFGRFALQSWRLDGLDLLLLPASGPPLRFVAQEEGGWAKMPAGSRPLVLTRP
ncbi:AprI/Inh family metalloprotease inhibitor [Ancylobacter lacus]|uniref:AprI/Inh family metalloprotease inhibitor n=1 Tax=Ancylobacter lacus TaxID=2579970 RepID=UPI001BCA6860|nr:AprI/Inh family metalloprotease inhibitor [Ancylobacter lacus]MBS7540051.1 AprI/Inh family metalloprotease inhibitor [Ancylobacter lacus]